MATGAAALVLCASGCRHSAGRSFGTTGLPPAVTGTSSGTSSVATAPATSAPPGAGSCHARGSGLDVLPDPPCTPGATNPTVTQATIHQTICTSGWTATVRPPESYTEQLKYQ